MTSVFNKPHDVSLMSITQIVQNEILNMKTSGFVKNLRSKVMLSYENATNIDEA